MLRMTPLKKGLLGAVVTFAAMWIYMDWRAEVGPDQVGPTLIACGQTAIIFFLIFWGLGRAWERVMLAMDPLGTADKKQKAGDPSRASQPTFRDIISAIRAIIHQDKNSK